MPGGRNGPFAPREAVVRPADPAVRRANARRIFKLFRPYRLKLLVVSALIVFSSGLGVIPAFLLRDVFNKAIKQRPDLLPEVHMSLLVELTGGMIAIAVVTGALSVFQ